MEVWAYQTWQKVVFLVKLSPYLVMALAVVLVGCGFGGVSCGNGWLVSAGVTGGCPLQNNLNIFISPPSTSMSISFLSGFPDPFHSNFSSILGITQPGS